jgi:hypothetical protein
LGKCGLPTITPITTNTISIATTAATTTHQNYIHLDSLRVERVTGSTGVFGDCQRATANGHRFPDRLPCRRIAHDKAGFTRCQRDRRCSVDQL